MPIGIQICSGTEWRAAKTHLAVPRDRVKAFPYGEFFHFPVAGRDSVFFHCRRTKVRAAGACQYAIDRWQADPVIVLGTCGGVGPDLGIGDIIVATKTIQYDCQDRRTDMGHTVLADTAWLALAGLPIHRGPIASADRDMTFDALAELRAQDVLGADWESGAIAAVCAFNHVRWAVLRAISDVPLAPGEDDARRQLDDYAANTDRLMAALLDLLPRILENTR
ncbi:MAG: 5'-methylthioadenosine/S-adenosylhomocysteine nucleosidase [Pseudomonadota bacterium]